MKKKYLFVVIIASILLMFCSKTNEQPQLIDKDTNEQPQLTNKEINTQSQLTDIEKDDEDYYYQYSPDGRPLFDDLFTEDMKENADNRVKEGKFTLLSFLCADEPKKIYYSINGNKIIENGDISKLNLYSEYGDSFDKHGIEHLRYYSINYFEIEYENKDKKKEILKFKIYDFIPYMSKSNSLVLRLSTGLLNDVEKPHNDFDGRYHGNILIDTTRNIVKIVVEYVPSDMGVSF